LALLKDLAEANYNLPLSLVRADFGSKDLIRKSTSSEPDNDIRCSVPENMLENDSHDLR